MRLLFLAVLAVFYSASAMSAVRAERPLLSFHLEPTEPKLGEVATLFVQVATGLQKNELVLEAQLDGAVQRLTKTAGALWTGPVRAFHELKGHQVAVNIYARDLKESQRLRSAMAQLLREVQELDVQIEAEADPQKKLQLEAQRDQKQAYYDTLSERLDSLKTFVKSETFDFRTWADPENTAYPSLVSVTPNAVPVGKRVAVTVTGANFGASPVVRMGGLNATVQSVTSDTIQVLAPNFTSAGAKDIEVIVLPADGQPRKNAVLTEAFFAADRFLLKNIRPVAVATGFLRVNLPATGTLQAGNSYDENGDVLSFEWTVTRVPAGSAITVGTVLADSATPEFAPDIPGIFNVRLRVREQGTTELFYSFPTTITIEVIP